jgi:hypothetical protein
MMPPQMQAFFQQFGGTQGQQGQVQEGFSQDRFSQGYTEQQQGNEGQQQ